MREAEGGVAGVAGCGQWMEEESKRGGEQKEGGGERERGERKAERR